MKGVSALVVILLIVVITIFMFSMVYLTVFGVLTESGEGTEEIVEGKQEAMNQKFAIDNANANEVYIRNAGDVAVNGGNLKFFVNGQSVDIISFPESIPPKQVGTFVLDPTQLSPFSEIRVEVKVTGIGLDDSKIVMFNITGVTTTTSTTSTSTTTTLPPSNIYLSVVLDTPIELSSSNVQQNGTFVVRANVTCVGGNCGNINGTLRYNASGNEPNTPITNKTTIIISANFDGDVDNAVPNNCNNGGTELRLERASEEYFIYVRFPLNSLPIGAVVTEVNITYNVTQVEINPPKNSSLQAYNQTGQANPATDACATRRTYANNDLTPYIQDTNLTGFIGLKNFNLPGAEIDVQNAKSAGKNFSIGFNCGTLNCLNSGGWVEAIDNAGNNEMKLLITYAYSAPLLTNNQNPQSCAGNPLSSDQTCQLTWTVNATGTIGSTWNIDALFTSDTIASNNTRNAQVNIIEI